MTKIVETTLVARKPSEALLRSMCLRFDHSYGLPYCPGFISKEQWAKNRELLMKQMTAAYQAVVETGIPASVDLVAVNVSPTLVELSVIQNSVTHCCKVSAAQIYEEVSGKGFHTRSRDPYYTSQWPAVFSDHNIPA